MKKAVVAAALLAVCFLSGCEDASAPRPGRYVVTHSQQFPIILTDTQTGKTWSYAVGENGPYWSPLPMISN